MFAARLQEGVILKKIFDAIKELVSNVNIEVGPTGINIQAMDASHIALVSLFLQENGFKEYRADRNFIIGLDVNNLFKILRCAGNDDVITLKTEQEEPTFLRFIFEDPKSEKVSEFNLNLITLDNEQLGIPEAEHSCIVTMSSSEFAKTIRELSALSETVSIECTKEYIRFSVAGDIGTGSIKIRARDSEKKDERTILEVDEDVQLSFALRYLNMFAKASALSSQVVLCLSKDAPLIVDFKIENLGSLKFYLAPKINEEEAQ